jgi:hypothetical protein
MPPSKHLLVGPVLLALLVVRLSAAADEKDTALEEDEKLVRDAKEPTDTAGLVAFFRKRTLSEADRAALQGLVEQLGARSFARREDASRRLVRWGMPAKAFLEPATRSTDAEIARRARLCLDEIALGPGPSLPCAAARLLARRRPSEAVAVLLGYLPYADDDVVRDEVLAALLTLAQDKDKTRLAPLTPALKDTLPLKRAAAAYVLGRSADKDVRAPVKKLLADKDPVVRLRAAQGLLAAHDKDAVPVLIDLLAGQSADVVWQVEDLLLRIAGESGPVAPSSLNEKERQDYRDRWAKWWEDNAAKADLPRLAEAPPLRGWTIIAQMSTNRVYEIDRQGKTRWTIDSLSGPIDAHVLPGDRVLIAEHHGSRITERNLRGNVLWEKRLNDRPVSVQRLPNGNTFIATYASLLEVTRDGKEVYNYRPEGAIGQIYAGQKLRNGRLVCVTLSGQVLELDSANGKVVRSIKSGLDGCYSVQGGLPGGHYLVASYNSGQVVELDHTGKILWKHTYATAYHAERLANGNYLIASHGQSRVIEVNRDGKTVFDQGTNGSNVWRVHRR